VGLCKEVKPVTAIVQDVMREAAETVGRLARFQG
jgi:hypothetical protein